MLAPEQLLRMDPADALRAMIGDTLTSPLKPSYLKLGPPVDNPASVLGTNVDVSIDITRTPVELWDKSGTFTYEYQRYAMDTFFAGADLTIDAAFPLSSADVITAILSRYRIPCLNTEVVEDYFDKPGTYNLVVDAGSSYRWFRGVSFTLRELQVDIAPILKVTRFTPSFDSMWSTAEVMRQLVIHLNLANAALLNIPVDLGMFTFSNPVQNDALERADNTRIELTFTGIPYTGNVTLFYSRRVFFGSYRNPPVLSGPKKTYTADLVDQLSVALGCTISRSDIASDLIPDIPIGGTDLVMVRFHANSLAYAGEVWVKYTRTS